MKIYHLSILFLCLFSVPVSADFICTDGIMDKDERCHSCDSTYEIQVNDMQQAIKNCSNRYTDFCGNSKLKCNNDEILVGQKCFSKCEDGKWNDMGECCKDSGICFHPICSFTMYGVSPFFIMDDEDAKNFTCNDGVMDRDGRCHPCLDETSILTQNSQESIKNCPNRLIDECGFSKLKCDVGEEKIGNKCFQKCKDDFTRNKNNECCNQNTGECVTKQCPMYI